MYTGTIGINKKTENKSRASDIPKRVMSMLLVFLLIFSAGMGAASAIIHLSYPRQYEQLVRENCQRFGVEESLVYAVIRTESGFNPHARSSVGAMGLMQIMPETFHWLQTKLPAEEDGGMEQERLLEPEINIRYGVYLLSLLRSEFDSDILAAAAYHAGIGQVRRWINSGELAAGSRYSDIPSEVTSHYVHKVEKARRIYYGLYYQ